MRDNIKVIAIIDCETPEEANGRMNAFRKMLPDNQDIEQHGNKIVVLEFGENDQSQHYRNQMQIQIQKMHQDYQTRIVELQKYIATTPIWQK